MTPWHLDPEAVGANRHAILTADTSFEAILGRLRKGKPPGPQPEEGDAGSCFEGACRPIWTLTPADRDAVDLFFNGRDGYRAAYCRGVVDGDAANELALQFLAGWLHDFEGVPVSQSSIPLLGDGAKLWFRDEEDKRVATSRDTGQVLAREVLVPAWLRAADKRLFVHTSKGIRYKAAAGVLAPRVTCLRVFGAWLRNGAVVNERAKDRSLEIHSYGYT